MLYANYETEFITFFQQRWFEKLKLKLYDSMLYRELDPKNWN
jgi:hypothetical protein